MRFLALTVATVLLLGGAFGGEEEDLVVNFRYGALKGKYMTSRLGKKFMAFLGIPYAKPPVGELRFQPPVPAEPWKEVRDATEDNNICLQESKLFGGNGDLAGSEDCLFLNVYTSKVGDGQALPVMVFVHGGAYTEGSGNSLFYEPDYLMDKDVILVGVNYRLGPFGFLTTGDAAAPGNIGLKDQVQALKWVQENIGSFGGDPNSVTIFGESAGGASTHYLTLSPLTKGLIHRTISQSGNAFSQWARHSREDASNVAKSLASVFNCPTGNSKEMVECLQGVPAEDIMEKQRDAIDDKLALIIFRPIVEGNVDGSFLPEEPIDLIKAGKINQVPWMVGVNADEGAVFSVQPDLLQALRQDFDAVFPSAALVDRSQLKDVMADLKKFYFKDESLMETSSKNIVDAFSDAMFVSPADQAVRAHHKYSQQPIYHYLFDYRGAKTLLKLFGSAADSFGATHADDLFYLFPQNMLIDGVLNGMDEKVAEKMLTMWTNFAKHGSPNSPNEPEVWKPVSSEGNEHLHIRDSENLKMESNMFEDRVKFWRGEKTAVEI